MADPASRLESICHEMVFVSAAGSTVLATSDAQLGCDGYSCGFGRGTSGKTPGSDRHSNVDIYTTARRGGVGAPLPLIRASDSSTSATGAMGVWPAAPAPEPAPTPAPAPLVDRFTDDCRRRTSTVAGWTQQAIQGQSSFRPAPGPVNTSSAPCPSRKLRTLEFW